MHESINSTPTPNDNQPNEWDLLNDPATPSFEDPSQTEPESQPDLAPSEISETPSASSAASESTPDRSYSETLTLDGIEGFTQESPSDSVNHDSLIEKYDHESSITGSKNFIIHLQNELARALKENNRANRASTNEISQLIGISEDYLGYVLTPDNQKSPNEIFAHLANKYDQLSNLYSGEKSLTARSDEYKERANLARQKLPELYDAFLYRHGFNQTTAKPENPSNNPDALSLEAIL